MVWKLSLRTNIHQGHFNPALNDHDTEDGRIEGHWYTLLVLTLLVLALTVYRSLLSYKKLMNRL
jgi:hypothetical protein